MAWTKHGHQIPDSPVEGVRPAERARCGGPKLCPHCMQDVRDYRVSVAPPVVFNDVKELHPDDLEIAQKNADIARRCDILTGWGVHVTKEIFDQVAAGIER